MQMEGVSYVVVTSTVWVLLNAAHISLSFLFHWMSLSFNLILHFRLIPSYWQISCKWKVCVTSLLHPQPEYCQMQLAFHFIVITLSLHISQLQSLPTYSADNNQLNSFMPAIPPCGPITPSSSRREVPGLPDDQLITINWNISFKWWCELRHC